MRDLQLAQHVDVRENPHALAVARPRDVRHLRRVLLGLAVGHGQLLVAANHLGGGIDRDRALVAIEQDLPVRGEREQAPVFRDDHRQLQRAGKNGHVRRDAAADKQEAFRALGGQFQDVGRHQFAGDDHRTRVICGRLLAGAQVL